MKTTAKICRYRSAALVLLAGVMSGCATMSGLPSSGGAEYQRGWIKESDNKGYEFKACHATEWQKVSRTPWGLNRLFETRSTSDLRPLYVEWLARQSEEGVSVSELRYMSTHPTSCENSLPDVDMRVRGTSPDWVLELTETDIVVHLYESLRSVKFPIAQPMRSGNTWIWDAEIELNSGRTHRLNLEIKPEACIDDENNWFGLTAYAQFDNQSLVGCAKRGDLERLYLNQSYRLSDEITTRDIQVSLTVDGQFEMTEDYLNDQPVTKSAGSWKMMSGGRVIVSVDNPEEGGRQDTLFFRHMGDGVLQLQGFHPSYGHNGLVLYPAGDALPWRAGSRLPVP